jgi:hypothetical protein
MAVRTSNRSYITVLDPVPTVGNGWEVVVRAASDYSSVLAVIPRWKNISFSTELSGAGGGSVTLALDDPVLTTDTPVFGASILDDENLWEFYWDGVLRSQWLGAKTIENEVISSEDPTVTIAGKGIADCLRRAVVLPPDYPTVPPFYWTFTGVSLMSMWLDFFNAAVARGTIDYMSTTITSTTDSVGGPWPDSSSVQHENGANLYELLVRYAQTVGADWVVQSGFVVDVRLNFGSHLEDTVIFHVTGSQEQRSKERDSTDVGNVVIAQDSYGALSTVLDGDSVTNHGRREMYVNAGTALDSVTRGSVASAVLLQNKNPKNSIDVTVSPDQDGRTVFVDYNVGDWIGVEGSSNAVTAYRVKAISVSVDSSGSMTVQITLNTKSELFEEKMQKAVEKLGGGGSSSTVTAATPISVGIIAAAAVGLSNLDDLADVDVGSATEDQFIVFNGSNVWVPHTPSLDNLSDVDVTTSGPADGEGLLFDSSSGLWKPGPVGGGGGSSVFCSLADATAFSSSSYAWKGQQFQPFSDVTINSLLYQGGVVSGGTYQGAIITYSGGTIDTVELTSPVVAAYSSTTELAQELLSFPTPINLIAGTSYGMLAGRTDQTGTYALPIGDFNGSAASFLPGMPGTHTGTYLVIASTTLSIGTSVSTGSSSHLHTVGAYWEFT